MPLSGVMSSSFAEASSTGYAATPPSIAAANSSMQEANGPLPQSLPIDLPSQNEETLQSTLHTRFSPWDHVQFPGSISSQSQASQPILGGKHSALSAPGSDFSAPLRSDAGLLSRSASL